ncbi:MAG: hypothetical protein ABWX76_13590 [Leifsonia flava]
MTDIRTGSIVDLWRRVPWWGQALLIFGTARIVTTGILLVFAAGQPANAWTGASPAYVDFASMWDGRWYNIVAEVGYPSDLPLTADGHVAENAWAFMPVYPAIVRLFMVVTGLPWAPAAVAVSVVCGFVSAVLVAKLFRLVLDPGTAMFAVVLYAVSPLSPVLQVAYAESMHLMLLAGALYLVMRHRYWAVLPVVAVMSFTRPSGLAFALFLALHVAYRWWKRSREPFPRREVVAASVTAVASGVFGLGWLLIAWVVTGSVTAYTDTELAWRSSYIGYTHLVPFTPWIQGLDWWAVNGLGLPAGFWWGFCGVLVLVAGAVVLLFSPQAKRLGVDLRLWVASYLLYLLAVFFPQSSTFRLLVPVFPLAGVLAQPTSIVYRLSVVALSLAGQVGWIFIAWQVDGYDWTPP